MTPGETLGDVAVGAGQLRTLSRRLNGSPPPTLVHCHSSLPLVGFHPNGYESWKAQGYGLAKDFHQTIEQEFWKNIKNFAFMTFICNLLEAMDLHAESCVSFPPKKLGI